MTTPLRILFIWHHHQPYYKTDGTFLMPWVRMHGIKDYWDMVRMLDDYPHIKQTFNFAPSLLEQIADYLDGTATDLAYLLSSKDPENFSDADKVAALKTFFLANQQHMIHRYPRYAELLEMRGSVKSDRDFYAVKERFTSQDYRDLQVWWNLAWVGEYSRYDPPFKKYIEKGRGFSEEEKHALLSAQKQIIARIIPHHIRAAKRGQIEISVSPFYHPILPLLCDTSAAIDANDRTVLPLHRFRYPDDARYQIKSALDYAKEIFRSKPSGMWPSEGSVSDAALKLFATNKVSWVATDEAVLHKTLVRSGHRPSPDFLEKYFAHTFNRARNSLKIFFRDHGLSDMIGFVYSNWGPDDAGHDFISKLLNIRDRILNKMGETALKSAVVPVILDGENAWEFYQSDGKDFLRTLYYLLESEPRLATSLPSEIQAPKRNILRHVEPGSWINANFDIWIGHQEDNKAWELLYEARKRFERKSGSLPARRRAEAFKELMIAEGSDWCWWYGDEHKSTQAVEFDELFRRHLKKVYSTMGIKPPAVLDEPIKRKVEHLNYRQPSGRISPVIAKETAPEEWKNAGFAEQEDGTGAMQKTGIQIKRLRFGNDEKSVYLTIETTEPIGERKLVIEFFTPSPVILEVGKNLILKRENADESGEISIQYAIGESTQIRIGFTNMKTDEASFAVALYDQNVLVDALPHQGVVKFKPVQ